MDDTIQPLKILEEPKKDVADQRSMWVFKTNHGVKTAAEIAKYIGLQTTTFLKAGREHGFTKIRLHRRGIDRPEPKLQPRQGVKILNESRIYCPINTGVKVVMTEQGVLDYCKARRKDSEGKIAALEFGIRKCSMCKNRKGRLQWIPDGVEVSTVEEILGR